MSQALTHTLTPETKAALDAGDVDALLALHRATFGGYRMEADPADPADPKDDDEDPKDPDDDEDPKDPDTGDDSRVKRANRQAAQYRTELRAAQAELQEVKDAQQQTQGVLEALRKAITGDNGDDAETDPAEQVTQLTTELETLRTDNADLRAQLVVHDIAGDHNANPRALLDSRSFLAALGKLDASSDDYQDQVAEAIKSAVEKNTSLRAGQGSRRGGAEGAGRTDSGAVTQEQFNAMSAKDRSDLFQTNPTLYRKLADGELAAKRQR